MDVATSPVAQIRSLWPGHGVTSQYFEAICFCDVAAPLQCNAEWTQGGQYPNGPNPYSNAEGCDFMEEFNTPYFDFACIHMYPDKWLREKQDDWVP